MRRSRSVSLVLAATFALLMLGCKDVTDTTAPSLAELSSTPVYSFQLERLRTLDDWFARTAEEVPGFAGAYFDQDGALVLRLADTTRLAEAEAALGSHLVGRRRSAEGPAIADEGVLPGEIRVVQSEYSFRDLHEWKMRARLGILVLDGVVSLDISEANNRLHIGISDFTASRQVEAVLQQLDIPRAAVRFIQSTPIELNSGRLIDRYRRTKAAESTSPR